MRHHIEFGCDGETLFGTVDGSIQATHGLLILSGGNEIRSGGHRGMAQLATILAAKHIAVFRFDRRGIGDSSGGNAGFMRSNADLAAAIAAFRMECPALRQISGLGLCDAAAALVLHPSSQSLDKLILLNPWTLETAAETAAQSENSDDADTPAPPPAAAIRARYIAKLKNPHEIWRLLSGGVNLGKLLRGLRQAGKAPAQANPDGLPAHMKTRLADMAMPAHILIAQKDTTAMAFMAHWHSRDWANVRANPALRVIERDTASHSFAGVDDAAWLANQVRNILD